MLKSIHRLSTKQFMEVMEKGRIYTSPLFVMRVLDQGLPLRSTLAGISAVAPKKILPTAVKRNRMRRQIYEAVRPFITTLKPGVSAIIFAKKETISASFETIQTDLKQLFLKAKISV